jgi:hypothetical protein
LLRRTAVVVALALAAPVLPSLAAPGLPVLEPALRTVALAVGTTTAVVRDERLVGVTWESGTAEVRVRWRTPAGWTTWDAPETEAPAGTTPSTEPVWRPTGATQVAVEVTGRPRGLRLVTVADKPTRTTAFSTRPAHAAEARTAAGLMGGVKTRKDWGADESIRRGRPEYARSVKAVVIHHTAQRNDYAAGEVPAMIRADYAYHVRSRGWDDLGYNLLVDRFGQVWEGRKGGLGRATIGSHAAGFNTSTLGVAVLGDYTRTGPTPEVTRALARVAAYAAGTWGWDPTGKVALTSKGSPRYRSGRSVTLPRVFGHQQTSTTACPGSLMDVLGDIRKGAKVLVGPAPRVTETAVTGAPVHAPLPLTVTAKLSREAPWTAEVKDPSGEVVARMTGESADVRLQWDGLRAAPVSLGEQGPAVLPAAPGDYTWQITVDDGWHVPFVRQDLVAVGLPVVPV